MRRRIATIGLGRVWTSQAQALAQMEDRFEVVAACDSDPERLAGSDVSPLFQRVEELLDSVQVDATLVSVPTPAHAAVAQSVLERGVPVLLEKPATTDLPSLTALYDICAESGSLLQVAFHAAFSPEVDWLVANFRELCARYGEPKHLRAVFLDPYASGPTIDPAASSLVSSWLDSGINALSVIDRLFSSSIIAFRSLVVPSFWSGDIHATGVVNLAGRDVECKLEGIIETDWTAPSNQKTTVLVMSRPDTTIRVDHSKHRIELLYGSTAHLLFSADASPPRLASHYQRVFDEFFKVLEGAPCNRESALFLHGELFGTKGLPPV